MTSLWLFAMLAVGVSARSFGEPDWGFQSYLDDDFTLECNHSTLIVEPFNYVIWRLPSGEQLSSTNVGSKYVLSNGPEGVVNMKLTVKTVTDGDAGVYQCHVFTNNLQSNKRGFLIRGLNVGGPMYRDPFDEYRNNLLIGGIAAAALLVPFVTLCLVYKFRYQTDEQRRKKYAQRDEMFKHQRHFEENGNGTELATSKGGKNNLAYENASDLGPTHL